MTAEIIRPVRFSVDPQVAGPIQRMRLANATAANSFLAVHEGLVSMQQDEDLERARELADLAEALGSQMRRLAEETRNFIDVLRAD